MRPTHRVAVIGRTGRGNYGHAVDTAWLDIPNTQIVAVADDDKAGLAGAVKRLKVNRAFSDYRKMLIGDLGREVVATAFARATA